MAILTGYPFVGMRGSTDTALVSPYTGTVGGVTIYDRNIDIISGMMDILPNEEGSLSKLLSMLPVGQPIISKSYYYNERGVQTREATISGVYTNAALTTTYPSAQSDGAHVFVSLDSSTDSYIYKNFRPGNMVMFRSTTDEYLSKVGKIQFINDAVGYIEVELAEADAATASGNTIGNANVLILSGDSHAEGGFAPEPQTSEGMRYQQNAQTFMQAWEISNDALKMQYNTKNPEEAADWDALTRYTGLIDYAIFFGRLKTITAAQSRSKQPEYQARGIEEYVRTFAPQNEFNFATATSTLEDSTDNYYVGKTWDEAGLRWVREVLLQVGRYGSKERIAMGGDVAINSFSRLIENKGDFVYNTGTTDYGLSITRWEMNNMAINMVKHPSFSLSQALQRSLFIIDLNNIKLNWFRNTESTRIERKTTDTKRSVFKFWEGCLGWELHNPASFAILHGLGRKNMAG